MKSRRRDWQIKSYLGQFPITLTSPGNDFFSENTSSRARQHSDDSVEVSVLWGLGENGECSHESCTSGLLITDWESKQMTERLGWALSPPSPSGGGEAGGNEGTPGRVTEV